MPQNAGYLSKLKHATTLGGTYTSIEGATTASLDMSIDELDISDLKDDDGWRRFIMGMGGGQITFDMDVVEGDTQQDALRTALTARTTVFLSYLYDGTNGFKGEFYITNISYSGAPEAKSSCSVTARLSGAPTAV